MRGLVLFNSIIFFISLAAIACSSPGNSGQIIPADVITVLDIDVSFEVGADDLPEDARDFDSMTPDANEDLTAVQDGGHDAGQDMAASDTLAADSQTQQDMAAGDAGVSVDSAEVEQDIAEPAAGCVAKADGVKCEAPQGSLIPNWLCKDQTCQSPCAQVSGEITAGDLIKASSSAVWYYADDCQRYVFPNEQVMYTWFLPATTIKTVTDELIAKIPLNGNVVIRGGTYLVKITSIPKVYAVGFNGRLFLIKDEAAAKALYGDFWSSKVIDIPDGFWPNYVETGETLTGERYPEAQIVRKAGANDMYMVNSDGTWSKLTGSAFADNNFRFEFLIVAPASVTFTPGPDITGVVPALIDPSKTGCPEL